MPQKKPMVMGSNGLPQVIQPGDYIAEVDLPSHINGEATTINKCMAVYISASNTVRKARADAAGTLPVYALAAEDITNGVSGMMQTDGNLTATTGQWDSVTGQTGGLTPNTNYFASDATAGSLTVTPPTTGYVQIIGIAVSSTTMKIKISDEIKL